MSYAEIKLRWRASLQQQKKKKKITLKLFSFKAPSFCSQKETFQRRKKLQEFWRRLRSFPNEFFPLIDLRLWPFLSRGEEKRGNQRGRMETVAVSSNGDVRRTGANKELRGVGGGTGGREGSGGVNGKLNTSIQDSASEKQMELRFLTSFRFLRKEFMLRRNFECV